MGSGQLADQHRCPDRLHQRRRAALFADEVRFPDRVVEDAGTFDALVTELADMAAPRPSVHRAEPWRRRSADTSSTQADQPIITAGCQREMCDLHDQGRNHIWGYYLRNLARPFVGPLTGTGSTCSWEPALAVPTGSCLRV